MKFNRQNSQDNLSISVLDRYLIRQLGCFFLFSVSLMTSLGVAIGTISDLAYKVSEYQLPIPVALLIFGYKIPEYAAYALPISILLTGLIIYARLHRDRELIALYSVGINLYRAIVPAIVFSFLITGITFLLNELIVPAANYQANLLETPYIAKTEINLQRQDIYYAEYQSQANNIKQLQQIYFAERYQQPNLLGVTIISFSQNQLQQIITARSARWNAPQKVWTLSQGTLNRFQTQNQNNLISNFTHLELPFSGRIFEIISQARSPKDMNIRQAKAYVSLIEDSAEPSYIAKFRVRIQQKYAFPFICLVFMLIGSALGAKYAQLNRAKSFALCVALVFGYYCLGFALGSLGITGMISPWWSAWSPNLIGLGIGGYLLIKVNNSR